MEHLCCEKQCEIRRTFCKEAHERFSSKLINKSYCGRLMDPKWAITKKRLMMAHCIDKTVPHYSDCWCISLKKSYNAKHSTKFTPVMYPTVFHLRNLSVGLRFASNQKMAHWTEVKLGKVIFGWKLAYIYLDEHSMVIRTSHGWNIANN